MNLSNFNDLLNAARAQPEAQRLLFVFAVTELPQHHTPGQDKRFQAGVGGALAPVMRVDKAAGELPDFAALRDESRRTGQSWDVMFAAALAGIDGHAPIAADIERALRTMIDGVHRGAIERFAAFAPDGGVLQFH